MKRIYTITLEDGEYPSNDVERNMKFLATLLYEEVMNLEYGFGSILYRNNLIYNELFESGSKGSINYYFKSEKNSDGYEMYEPFVLNNTSFGFTVYDGKIDSGMVQVLLEHIQKIMNISYKFKIDDTLVFDKDKERIRLLKEFKKKKVNIEKKNNGRKLTKTMPLFTILGVVGR